jgi:hypothetical protein
MSRIRLRIDRLVLNGFPASECQRLAASLQAELSRSLSKPEGCTERVHPHQIPILNLSPVILDSGLSEGRRLGAIIAHRMAKRLRL